MLIPCFCTPGRYGRSSGLLKSFGDVLSDVMLIAADDFFSAIAKKNTFHWFMSPEEIKKFDAQTAKDDAAKPPSENFNKLATDILTLGRTSSVVGSQLVTAATGGRPNAGPELVGGGVHPLAAVAAAAAAVTPESDNPEASSTTDAKGGRWIVLKPAQTAQTAPAGANSPIQAMSAIPASVAAAADTGSLPKNVGPGGAMSWQAPPGMGPQQGSGSTLSSSAGPISAPAATPGATMADGLATVLAKLDALISALKDESGFLQKVLS